jgi:hypothetical protein
MPELLTQYADILIAASEAALAADVTLRGQPVMGRSGDLVVSYAPFEHIQRGARLVIVGITPGAQQARNALMEARRRLLGGESTVAALAAAKVFASFSGPMRANLVSMLDHVGLQRWLGVPSTEVVWTTRSDLVHFTSVLRYPVFVGGKNYSGAPSMTITPLLKDVLARHLREEAETLSRAVWVPLGPKATEGVSWLVQQKILSPGQVLAGLPHPSGANAERVAYFLRRKPRTALSVKTSPDSIDTARELLLAQIAALPVA